MASKLVGYILAGVAAILIDKAYHIFGRIPYSEAFMLKHF